MTTKHCIVWLGTTGLIALLGSGCNLVGMDTIRPGDAGTEYGSDANLQVSFLAERGGHHDDKDDKDDDDKDDGDVVETSCGLAAGIRLQIDGPGPEQVCEELWAPAQIDGHVVADCMFVVEPGRYRVEELSAISASGRALDCCDSSDFPRSIRVRESETTELGGVIECDLENNGGLDIYATVNTPPVIEDLDIEPSKFAATCAPIALSVDAVDQEGDLLTYDWAVVQFPANAEFELNEQGDTALFRAETLGDYTLRVTATDEFGASAWLTFPLHIVEEGDEDCDL